MSHQRWTWGLRCCRWRSTQVRNTPWLWKPVQTSPEVQNRGNSSPTKMTNVLQKFKEKNLLWRMYWPSSITRSAVEGLVMRVSDHLAWWCRDVFIFFRLRCFPHGHLQKSDVNVCLHCPTPIPMPMPILIAVPEGYNGCQCGMALRLVLNGCRTHLPWPRSQSRSSGNTSEHYH